MYKCSFCGKEYDTAGQRARCEITCEEKARVEAERAEKEKLEATKAQKMDEIKGKIDEVQKLLDEYNKEYGTTHSIATSISLSNLPKLHWDDIWGKFICC